MKWILFSLLFLALPLAAQQRTNHWRVAIGADYSSGDYGDAVDTDILFLPLSVNHMHGPLTLRLVVPYMDITGPADIFAPHNPGEEEEHAEETARTGVSGFGDVQLGLSSMHQLGKRAIYISPSAWVKLPTADEDKRLGTGESDHWLRVSGMAALGRGFWVFASGGYRWMGSSDAIPLTDRALGGAGMQVVRGRWSVGGNYDFQQSSVASADDVHEVTLFGSRRFGQTQCTLYGRSGFTDASPNFGLGLQVGYSF